MNHTCSGSNKKTGKSCSRKVAIDGHYCYQHGPTGDIPEDITQVIGRKPAIIDDIDEDGKQIIPSEEVFNSIIAPTYGNANTSYILPDKIEDLSDIMNEDPVVKLAKEALINHIPEKPKLNEIEDDTMEKDYSILWKRIKNFFKRSKK